MKTIKLSSIININIYILFIHIISGTLFVFRFGSSTVFNKSPAVPYQISKMVRFHSVRG